MTTWSVHLESESTDRVRCGALQLSHHSTSSERETRPPPEAGAYGSLASFSEKVWILPVRSTVRTTSSIFSAIVVFVVVLPSSFVVSVTSATYSRLRDVPRTTWGGWP